MAVDQRSEIENWGVKTNQLQDLNQNVDGGVGGCKNNFIFVFSECEMQKSESEKSVPFNGQKHEPQTVKSGDLRREREMI